jgi:oxygen-independent coproporphyrinogen-3 oxidase
MAVSMQYNSAMTPIRPLDAWGWNQDASPPIAAYIHVPFCRHRCGYCNFSLLADRSDLFDRYLNALERELTGLESPRPVDSIFLGGGTPSILPTPMMERMLRMLQYWLPLKAGGEWSMEANPLDIAPESLKHWHALGVRRVSIGGQSFQPEKLQCLERDHTPKQLLQSIDDALAIMDSVSLDLIFAAPEETLDGWRSDLNAAIASGVQHLSTYGLTFEKGARFWADREFQRLTPVSEETELQMYLAAIDTLTAAGWEHYEISNFAKPGYRCRHNQAYWNGDAWWAFGPSAARYVGGVRSVNHRSTLTYLRRIESDQSPIEEREVLDAQQQARERFVFGMRQIEGVPWSKWRESFDPLTCESIENVLAQHIANGWMQFDGDRVRLTRAGLVLSDGLWHEYLNG